MGKLNSQKSCKIHALKFMHLTSQRRHEAFISPCLDTVITIIDYMGFQLWQFVGRVELEEIGIIFGVNSKLTR